MVVKIFLPILIYILIYLFSFFFLNLRDKAMLHSIGPLVTNNIFPLLILCLKYDFSSIHKNMRSFLAVFPPFVIFRIKKFGTELNLL